MAAARQSDGDLTVILYMFDWIGAGATLYVYDALIVGKESTPCVIEIAKRSDDEPTTYPCEATILERLKDVD
ncbi:hypothetical protein Rt10032_c03g1710 [Rhodotorula toruloides]|uniref:Uncharacterized protein n=1 Tax=Rhodotorula toruloides TaxID=5286 RepID=A0A511KBE4_RHOTO|nr:hypothetical protein Rt10032_c03g1710 [Rhodotorula toruloides]